MSLRTLFRPVAVPAGKAFVRPLAALLLMSTALPALAGAATPTDRLLAAAEDAGPVDPTTPMTATVWLAGSNQAQLDGYVADAYNPKSLNYHRWLNASQLAAFGPTAQTVATMRQSLAAQGLKVESVFPDGAGIKVSGAAAKMQAAFGTSIHVKQSGGVNYFANVTTPRYQGAHPELVAAVSGLSSAEMAPFALRQLDVSTGQPMPAVPMAQNGSYPLSNFTTNCFGPTITATMTGITRGIGRLSHVTGIYSGQSYLNPATIFRPQCGYTAQQVVAHYGMNTVHANGFTGKGQTIVIVDAYGSPTIAADVNTFSQAMGLPAMTSTSLQIVYPDGPPPAGANGWQDETSLDVEWAHALAPDANIVLVVAPNASNGELAYAIHYAVAHQLGNVISNSWGGPEAGNSAAVAQMFNSVFKTAAAAGISVNVATGDQGDFGVGSPVGAASIPADSPYATGVGGTSINVPSDNGLVDTAWGLTWSQLGYINA
ncbi:MAG TPA: protease pro-enzyme activation domain-containing protein, partial [Acetobacteraceae bacterium]|nr:protease pro-enzyme activation domain-containing protein [Acetobacteraceae bacterium]